MPNDPTDTDVSSFTSIEKAELARLREIVRLGEEMRKARADDEMGVGPAGRWTRLMDAEQDFFDAISRLHGKA